MSFRTPVNCSTDSIGNLEKVFLDEMGAVFDTVITQAIALEEQIASSGVQDDIKGANSLLQDLISTGDSSSSIRYLDQVPALFGIDQPDSQEADEKRVFDTTGLVMTNGVFFKKADVNSDQSDNVEILRRVFNAVGRDLVKTIAEYSSSADVSYRYHLTSAVVKPDLPNRELTIDEVRLRLNDKTIIRPDYVELQDKSVLLVRRNPLLVPNITDTEIQPRFGYDLEEITSSVIHKNAAKNTSAAINNWVTQGFNVELPTILDGEDPALNLEAITPLFNEVKRLAGILLSDLSFYLQRIDSLDPQSIRSKVQTQLSTIDTAIKSLVAVFLTEVSVITEFDTLAKLRSKLSDDEIIHLLLNQRYVVGIDFEATDNEIMDLVSGTAGQVAGDNTASTAYLNTSPSLRDTNYTMILYCMADIQAAIQANQNTLTATSLKSMIEIVTLLMSRTLVTEATVPTPVAGYPCFTTPASIVLQRINYNKNFKVTLKIKALDDALRNLQEMYNETVGRLLSSLLKSLSNITQRAMQMINQLRDKLLSQITPLKRQLNEFISKYLTLIGGGDFDSSVFKCAINYNIGLSTGILDALEAMITRLAERINGLIAFLLDLLLKAITGIICPVLAFIEKILGSGNDYLPSFCSINAPVLLPADAVTALQDMRRIVLMQNMALTEYSGDLVRARATITTAPDRLNSFRNAANCMGQTANNLVSTTLTSISKGVSVPGLPI